VRSVSICFRERPRTFGNLANHSSPITERSRSFADKTAYWTHCGAVISPHQFWVELVSIVSKRLAAFKRTKVYTDSLVNLINGPLFSFCFCKIYKCFLKENYVTYFLCELSLEEVDVLCKVQGVLPALADHVCMEDVIRLLKHADHVRFLVTLFQRTLKKAHQQIDDLQNSLRILN